MAVICEFILGISKKKLQSKIVSAKLIWLLLMQVEGEGEKIDLFTPLIFLGCNHLAKKCQTLKPS